MEPEWRKIGVHPKFNTYTYRKRTLRRPRRRWKGNIRMDPKKIGINTRNWVDSDQNRYYWRALVNAAFYLRVP